MSRTDKAQANQVSRRQFLNRSIVGLMGFSIAGFAAASFVGFLWPIGGGGFGGLIRVGKLSDIKGEIEKADGFLYKAEGRMWMVEYPSSALPKARISYAGLAHENGDSRLRAHVAVKDEIYAAVA